MWLGPYVDFIADTLSLAYYNKDEQISEKGISDINRQFNSGTVKQNLIFSNTWTSIQDNHNYYNNIAVRVKDTVGVYFTNQDTSLIIDGKEYLMRSFDFENIGVELVAEWYKRNFIIYRNILEQSSPGDRIIVMFGQGHVRILQHMLEDNPLYEVISPLDFLQNEL